MENLSDHQTAIKKPIYGKLSLTFAALALTSPLIVIIGLAIWNLIDPLPPPDLPLEAGAGMMPSDPDWGRGFGLTILAVNWFFLMTLLSCFFMIINLFKKKRKANNSG